VSEDEIAEAVRALYVDTHNLVEGAGAAPFAALMKQREALKGKRAGIIISGGNIDKAVLLQILRGVTPEV
jgi:threonine dehydratase